MQLPKITPRKTLFLTPSIINWNDMDDVRKAFKGMPVRFLYCGVDLNGCQISGSKLKQPRNEDDESSIPLRIRIPGFWLINGSIRKIPGGIVFRKTGNHFADLVFLNTGEDAISNVVQDSPNATIRKCQFFGASDKSVQMNDARGLTFDENLIVGGITGVRLQKTDPVVSGRKTKSLKKNTFFNVNTAWNVSGGLTAVATGTVYENVSTKWKTSNGAKFTEK